ncbi:hypothetical protein [Lactobacillus helsingborgensis]
MYRFSYNNLLFQFNTATCKQLLICF